MRLLRCFACTLLAAVLLSGCVFTHIRTPLDLDLDNTQLGTKTGESSFKSYFWLVAVGDAGTQAAAENGGITTIRHADREMFSVLGGIYYRHTTVLYGD